MRILITFFILFFCQTSFAQTQGEMNADASAAYQESDEVLNEIYQAILSKYETDLVFLDKLKASQRLWIQFRDAELNMKYPEETYGSVQATCTAMYLKQLTDQRIETLKAWLRGTEEGEVCSGSVQFIEPIDSRYKQKATITSYGFMQLAANMKKDHRIFGYKEMDTSSEKMILFSIFTNEVKNNPFDCKYGAYYETFDVEDVAFKYMSTQGDFVKIGILKNDRLIDEVYMLKSNFDLGF